MPLNNNEETLRRIAKAYADREGEALLKESADLDEISAGRLERRVRREIGRDKRARAMRLAGSVAACVLLIVVAVQALLPESIAPSPAESRSGATQTASPSFEVIPLSFRMPDGFEQSGFEQDNEQSIYYIRDAQLDDVVLTMERAALQPSRDMMTAILVNGSVAYVSRTETYSLMTFTVEDTLYVLTCRYDVNTLVRLGEAIL